MLSVDCGTHYSIHGIPSPALTPEIHHTRPKLAYATADTLLDISKLGIDLSESSDDGSFILDKTPLNRAHAHSRTHFNYGTPLSQATYRETPFYPPFQDHYPTPPQPGPSPSVPTEHTDAPERFVSSSPSPIEPPPTSSFLQSHFSYPPPSGHSQDTPYPTDEDTEPSSAQDSDTFAQSMAYPRVGVAYPASMNPDNRRMSAPALFHPTQSSLFLPPPPPRFQPGAGQEYDAQVGVAHYTRTGHHILHRGLSQPSLRAHHAPSPRQQQPHQPPLGEYPQGWHEPHPASPSEIGPGGGNFAFSHGASGSAGVYDLYGASPPGTGTSVSSGGYGIGISAGAVAGAAFPAYAPEKGVEPTSPAVKQEDNSPSTTASAKTPHQTRPHSPDPKTYAFIPLPGNAVKKRPRRRYDEIERLYACGWNGCEKAYGTLNHLNAHVVMQGHGNRRLPGEFKELRKQWRKAKKDTAQPIVEEPRSPLARTLSISAPSLRRGSEPDLRRNRTSSYPYPRVVPPPLREAVEPGESDRDRVQREWDLEERQRDHEMQRERERLRERERQELYRRGAEDVRPPHRLTGAVPESRAPVNIPYPEPAVRYPAEATGAQAAPWSGPSSYPGASSTSTPSGGPVPETTGTLTATSTGLTSESESRLPPDSTLLTPLPGYTPSPAIFGYYPEDDRQVYGEDGTPPAASGSGYYRDTEEGARPDTGHSQAAESYYGDDRPGTGHSQSQGVFYGEQQTHSYYSGERPAEGYY